jgi:hypothetical protein
VSALAWLLYAPASVRTFRCKTTGRLLRDCSSVARPPDRPEPMLDSPRIPLCRTAGFCSGGLSAVVESLLCLSPVSRSWSLVGSAAPVFLMDGRLVLLLLSAVMWSLMCLLDGCLLATARVVDAAVCMPREEWDGFNLRFCLLDKPEAGPGAALPEEAVLVLGLTFWC